MQKSSEIDSVLECKKCLLSTLDTEVISFNDQGICSYCLNYDKLIASLGSKKQKSSFIESKIDEIKRYGKDKPYDCLLGVSGGVDSSYLAFWAKQNGLRPLVVHLDNGWNSELAVKNIESICENLGYELHTHVINWDEFKELQLAYLRASVVDIEVLTDHAIIAVVYKLAKKYNIKYTISGLNYVTEAIMPKGWTYLKTDFSNIKDIAAKFGNIKTFKTYPHLTFYKQLYYSLFLKISSIQVLNYIDYNKDEAKKLLIEKLGWRDYGGKHFESNFTKFYQIYILPLKFKIDKRKAHLSNLICSGQITKNQALKEMELPLYDENSISDEKDYVLKKFNLTNDEFDKIMNLPIRKHTDFKTDTKYWNTYFKLIKILRPWKK